MKRAHMTIWRNPMLYLASVLAGVAVGIVIGVLVAP